MYSILSYIFVFMALYFVDVSNSNNNNWSYMDSTVEPGDLISYIKDKSD